MATENQHKPNDFTPVVGALRLADYVIHITDNPNKFPDYIEKKMKSEDETKVVVLIQKSDSLTNWVRDQSRQIFLLTYTANGINLKKEPWRKNERLGNQADAIKLCEEHLAAIQLCRKHFHLSTRKIYHWGSMTRDLRIAIQKWHESDKDRYKDI